MGLIEKYVELIVFCVIISVVMFFLLSFMFINSYYDEDEEDFYKAFCLDKNLSYISHSYNDLVCIEVGNMTIKTVHFRIDLA